MKKFFTVLVFLLRLGCVFALGGVMSGVSGKLKVIETQYFDINYAPECKETAQKIAAVCDDYYREISAKFGYEPYQRFPVSITSKVESLNAYFSMAPYNTIVLYDTEIPYSLDMNEKSMEAVFYHELVHAVSLNSKSPFWRGMAFFADFFTPAGISLTSFWMEGAAVAFESMGDGGRLNSPFFTQKVIECKIQDICGENEFPSWRDLSGSKDVYPAGSEAYIFGSHFALFLIKTYGIEKYAEFWKNAGTWTTLSFVSGIFEKTYGQSISNVWNDFYDSIKVPQIELNERKNFVSKENLISKEKTVIQTIDYFYDPDSSKVKTAWFDLYSSTIYLNGQKFLTVKNVQRIRFSKDGTKLLVNRFVDKAHVVNDDFEVELKTKKITPVKHDSSLFEKDENLTTIKNGLSWSLFYKDESGRKKSWNFGNKIIHNIHLEKIDEDYETYIFVWAQMKSDGMAKLGKIQIDRKTLQAKIFLQENENPAGLIEAIPYGADFLVITEEYYSTPLRVLKAQNIKWSDFYIQGESYIQKTAGSEFVKNEVVKSKTVESEIYEENVFEPESSKSKLSVTEAKTKNYNPAKYFFCGAFLPLGIVSPVNHDFESEEVLFSGATYATSTPWNDKITMLSAGFNPFTSDSGLSLSLTGGDDSFAYSVNGNLVFNSDGLKSSYGEITASKVLMQGLCSSFSFGVTGKALSGIENTKTNAKVRLDYGEIVKSSFNRTGLSLNCKPYFYFSTLHRSGVKYAHLKGIYFQPFFDFTKTDLDYDFKNFGKLYTQNEVYANAGFFTGFSLPLFFPFSLEASLFPSQGTFAGLNASLQLYALEIQRGIPAVSVYVRRIVWKAVYSLKLKYEQEENFDILKTAQIASNLSKDDYTDYLRFAGEVFLAPNTSYFASSSVGLRLGSYVQYSSRTDKNSNIAYGFYVAF